MGHKNLTEIPAGTVMEVLAYRIAETKNGEVVVATVVLPEHEETRGETTLVIPGRFAEECKMKVPCLMYYAGKKQLEGGKQCHNATLIKVGDGTVFHASDV